MLTVLYGSLEKKLKFNSLELECYVLTDNSRIITKKSLQKALGYDGKSSDWLIGFLNGIGRFAYFPEKLLAAIDNPTVFENQLNGSTISEKGYTVPILEVICQFIINAKEDGYLNLSQLKIAKAAEKIMQAAELLSLERQIDEATGYNFFKANTKVRLKDFLLAAHPHPAFEWTTTFPDAFFDALFAHFAMNWNQLKEHPQKIAQFLYDSVFARMEIEVFEELQQTKPKRSYRKKNGDIQTAEHPRLKPHTDALLALLKASGNNPPIFKQLLNRTFPESPNWPKIDFTQIKSLHTMAIQPTPFDEQLKKSLTRKAVVRKKNH